MPYFEKSDLNRQPSSKHQKLVKEITKETKEVKEMDDGTNPHLLTKGVNTHSHSSCSFLIT